MSSGVSVVNTQGCLTRSLFVRGLMYVLGGNEPMTLDSLGTRIPHWRARLIYPFSHLRPMSVLIYVTSPWEHFLWILFINISKKPANNCLVFFLLLFGWLFVFFTFSWERVSSAGNSTAVGIFSRFARGDYCVWVWAVCLDGCWSCCRCPPPFLAVWVSGWFSVVVFWFGLFFWPLVNYLNRQDFVGVRFIYLFIMCVCVSL